MAVLIEGMEMPDRCGHCRFATAFDCGVDGQFIKTHDARRKDCPLVPVPEPHGRLGDLDALPWYLANTSVKYATYEDWEMLCDAIAAAPTVIPASPAEEG